MVVAFSIDAFTCDELLAGQLASRVAEVSPTLACMCVWGHATIPRLGETSTESLVKSMSLRMSYWLFDSKGAQVEVVDWHVGRVLSVSLKAIVKTCPARGDGGIAECV